MNPWHAFFVVIAVLGVARVMCAIAWFIGRVIRWCDGPHVLPPPGFKDSRDWQAADRRSLDLEE